MKTDRDALLFGAPKPEPRKPTPGLRLWTVYRDGHETRAELRPVHAYHGEGCCVEAQVFRDGELSTAKLHQSRDLAIGWADEIHRWLLDAGWTRQP